MIRRPPRSTLSPFDLHAFVAVASEGVEIERSAADGSLIDLEVAGVNNDAEGSAHGEGDAIDGAMGYGNEFDLEGADFHEAAAGNDFAEGGGFEEAGLVEALLYEREGETRSVHGDVEIAKDVSERADVIFMAVGEDDGADVGTVLFEVGDVRNDEV